MTQAAGLMERKLSPFSIMTVPIETLTVDGIVIERGTGFFHSFGEGSKSLRLITNWHIVTGRDPQNARHSRRNGAVPVTLRLKAFQSVRGHIFLPAGLNTLEIVINREDGEEPRWYELPERSFIADVVVLELDGIEDMLAKTIVMPLSQLDLTPGFTPELLDHVLVAGYPHGVANEHVFPIFKGGTIATDPALPNQAMPRYLIDCRTTSGMSGAPVLGQKFGISPGALTDASTLGTHHYFAGVYSGRAFDGEARTADDKMMSELGIVWLPEVVDQILSRQHRGTKLSEIGRRADEAARHGVGLGGSAMFQPKATGYLEG